MTAEHRTFAASLVANIFLLAMATKMVTAWNTESGNKNVKIIHLHVMRKTRTLAVYHTFGTFLCQNCMAMM